MVRKFCISLVVGLMACAVPQAQAGWGSWGGSSGGSDGGASTGMSSGGSSGGSWGSSGGGLFHRHRARKHIFGGGSSGGSWGGSSGGFASSGGSSGWHRPGPLARLFHRIHAKHAARRAYRHSYASSGGSSGGWGHASFGGSSGGSWGGSVGSGWTRAGYASAGSSGGGYSVAPHSEPVSPEEEYYEPSGNEASDEGAEAGTDSASDGSDSPSEARRNAAGILSVSVPEDAKVTVNGIRTKSKGAERRYISHGLKDGNSYRYVVEATVEREGRPVTERKTAVLRAGRVAQLDFDLASKVETTLTLNVPADAEVFLSGHATKSEGTVRRFATQRLAKGQKWGDYVVRVRVDRNGQAITQEKQVTLAGGDAKVLDFAFADHQLADAR